MSLRLAWAKKTKQNKNQINKQLDEHRGFLEL
jgi:hypothetical protein